MEAFAAFRRDEVVAGVELLFFSVRIALRATGSIPSPSLLLKNKLPLFNAVLAHQRSAGHTNWSYLKGGGTHVVETMSP